jgi:hypothetical protein
MANSESESGTSVFDADPNMPFVERLSGPVATLFAVRFCAKIASLPMQSEVWANTKVYWNSEALAQRAANRKIYLDVRYPLRPQIVTPGDRDWPN